MRWHIVSLRSILFLFAVFAVFAALLALPAQTVPAEKMNFSNQSLKGSYVAQSTGTWNFPLPPLSDQNGPYTLTGRLVADGYGNISGSGVQIQNGMVMPLDYIGTYEVEEDGTFLVTVTNESQISVEYYGVLFDAGKQAKLTAVSLDIPGVDLPPGFIGMTETGSLVRQ